MPFNVLDTISVTERLNFSQNFAVARPTVLDTLFPDVKTQHFKAEYYRLMQGQNLPTPAYVQDVYKRQDMYFLFSMGRW